MRNLKPAEAAVLALLQRRLKEAAHKSLAPPPTQAALASILLRRNLSQKSIHTL
jgi:hypothetical protein